MTTPCDVEVRGAGAVGAALALSLSRLGLAVRLVGAAAPPRAAGDVRAYALNPASVALLRSLRVWDALPADARTPVREMAVHGDAPGRTTRIFGLAAAAVRTGLDRRCCRARGRARRCAALCAPHRAGRCRERRLRQRRRADRAVRGARIRAARRSRRRGRPHRLRPACDRGAPGGRPSAPGPRLAMVPRPGRAGAAAVRPPAAGQLVCAGLVDARASRQPELIDARCRRLRAAAARGGGRRRLRSGRTAAGVGRGSAGRSGARWRAPGAARAGCWSAMRARGASAGRAGTEPRPGRRGDAGARDRRARAVARPR